MFLTASNIVHYLLERGLIPAQQVVDGDFMVIEAPRRNRNFKVMKRDRSGLFLKQVPRWDQPSLSTLYLEAHCYQLTHQQAQFAALRELVPHFHLFDERRAVLVTELLGGGESLAEHYFRRGEFPCEIATQLGRAFGQYHQVVKTSGGVGDDPMFPRRAPWILSFHQVAPQIASQSVSGGNTQLLEVLRRYPDFGRVLDRLAADWKTESLIHGDIKWDNCVLVPAPDRENPQAVALKLVDWELADWGDPCWDVAAIFSSFVVFWIQSLPFASTDDIDRAMKLTQYPLEKMQPAIRAFWKAYTEEMQWTAAEARAVLGRSVLLCGARTIQTAYEHVQSSPQLSQVTFLILQASLNILTRPEEATSDLLGLTVQ